MGRGHGGGHRSGGGGGGRLSSSTSTSRSGSKDLRKESCAANQSSRHEPSSPSTATGVGFFGLTGFGFFELSEYLHKAGCMDVYRKYKESAVLYSEDSGLAKKYKDEFDDDSCEKYESLYSNWWGEKQEKKVCMDWISGYEGCVELAKRKGLPEDKECKMYTNMIPELCDRYRHQKLIRIQKGPNKKYSEMDYPFKY